MGKVRVIDSIPAAWTKDDKVLDAEEKQMAADALKISRSEAYRDPSHPQHLRALRNARRLFTAAYGDDQEVQAELDRPFDSREKLWGVDADG